MSIRFIKEVYESHVNQAQKELNKDNSYSMLNNQYNELWNGLIKNLSEENKLKLFELDKIINELNSMEQKEVYKQAIKTV